MRPAFVDTSGWYAYLDRKARLHGAVAKSMERDGVRLVTSGYVFDELVTLVRVRQGHAAALHAGALLRDPQVVRLERISDRDEAAAWQRFIDRPDKAYSFTDCTSFVLMERLGIREAVATDEDFAKEGFHVTPKRR